MCLLEVDTRVDTASAVGIEIAIDPAGRFLYVSASTTQSVFAYSIDPATKMLSVVPGSPFALGGWGRQVVVDPTGHFLYVANQTLNAINALQIDQTTGALSALAGSPYTTAGTNTTGLDIDSAGEHLYVAGGGSPTGIISGFAVNAGTGALTPLPGSPYVAEATASGLKINPAGTFAVVSNLVGTLGTVSTFAIAGNGSLAQITGSPVAAGAFPISVAFDQTGRFVYVPHTFSANVVTGYAINAQTGTLTPLPGAPVASELGWSITLR